MMKTLSSPAAFLTLLCLTLKLTHAVDWSWWLVFSPIWAPLAFLGAVVLFLVGMAEKKKP